MNEKYKKIVKILKKVIDFILVILLAFLSIKKGGFYKNDNLEFNLIVTFIGIIYIIFEYIINIFKKYIRKKEGSGVVQSKKRKIDVIEILLLLLVLAYSLPIIFNNYSNLSDSIFEIIRYFNIYIIYVIVKKSDNKKLYVNSIIGIVFMQCLFGIDGLGNRYLLPFLEKFNSGYLTSDNLTRMSATIQYANVFSLLCLLADVYIIDKFKNMTKVTKEEMIEYFLIFVFTSSIILSKSRIILAILICYLAYVFNSKNSKNKLLIALNILVNIFYTTIFMKLLLINTSSVYLLTFIFYMCIVILYILRSKIYKFFNKVKVLVCCKFKSKKIRNYVILLLIGIYIVLAFSIKVPIKLNYSVNQNFISRNIYDLYKEKSNEISIKIKKEHEDSRYKIDIYEVNDKSESTLIQRYDYYSTISDTFKFNYIPKEDFKNLIIKVTCQKNSIQVLEILVNNKFNHIDYFLLPTDIVYRTIDTLNGDSSLKDRIYFTKDAINLIKLNTKNFFIGIGGDGFKNTYEMVKSNNYSSTEVHNVYLQIFVEAGIIGIIIFITLIIYALRKSKFNVIKLLFIIFCITSLFDLNFSYMFVMAIFVILLALLEEKLNINCENINNNINKYIDLFNFFKVIVSCVYGIFILTILIKANIAYYTKVPILEENNITFEQITQSISKYEKRVKLEPYENAYRYNLHLEYEKYFELFDIDLVESMEKNLLEMIKNDKYDSEILIEVSNEIIEYLEEFVNVKYKEDKEAGYEYYLSIVLENLEYIDNLKYNKEEIELVKTVYRNCYEKLFKIKVKYSYNLINTYIDILDKKLK